MSDDEVLIITMASSAGALAIFLLITQSINYSPIGGFGTALILSFSNFAAYLGLLVSALGTFITLVCCVSKKERPSTVKLLFTWIAIFIGLVATLSICQQIRQACLKKIIKNAAPLVVALDKFEQKYKAPPMALKNLSPEFLQKIPSTGLGSSQKFHYRVEKNGSWTLDVPLYEMIFEVEQLVYRPSKNYPDSLGAHGVEKLGDWAIIYNKF